MSSKIYYDKFVSQYKYYDFKDVLILPRHSKLNSRSEVNLEKTLTFNNNKTWTGIPIISANMTTTGTFDVYKVLSKYKIITCFHKFYTLNDFLKFHQENNENTLNPDYFMISTGISDSDYERLCNIIDNIECKFICIDIANGYIDNLIKYCKKVRAKYPNHIIVAGNVCTYDGVHQLIDCNIDIIECGIGGGSACTTRIQTGIGMPQLSCVIECSEAITGIAHQADDYNFKHYIISDGGITCPGDLGKAFGAGSDFVMIGGEFAGHDENPGKLIKDEKTGEQFKFFYGMSSSYAMSNNYAANNNKSYRSSEGREIKMKYKGKLDNTVQNYLGGLRSTCTYTNSKNIEDLKNNTQFILVNNQFNNNLVNGK